MKKLRRAAFLFAAILMISTLATAVFAAEKTFELESDGLTLKVPEEAYVLTPSTEITDEIWEQAGIANAVEALNLYEDLGVVAQFSMNENQDNIYLTRKESDMTQQYYDLATLTEEQKAGFLEMFNSVNDSGTAESKGEWYTGASYPFIRNYITSQVPGEDKVYHELHYFTIINGKSYSINTHGESEISAETEQMMVDMVNSMAFSVVNPRPELEIDLQTVVMLLIILGIFLFFIGVLIFAKVKNKREKKKTKELASRLVEYRRQQKEDFGQRLFENTTDHNAQAIRVFSRYQVYHRHFFRAVSSILATGLGTMASFYLGAAWWLTLILALTFAYCVYKFITAANATEKALTRIYSKLRTTVAHYVFYQEEFTISGTQSNQVYPYFQIRDMAEYQDYFFLFFGEDVTQYVRKDGFRIGDADQFRTFIREKIEQNKKM